VRWLLRSSDPDTITTLTREAGLTPVIARLVAARGIATREQADEFLSPSLSHLHSPYLMSGLRAAVDRLRAAIERGETIFIYGDYDVDGTTAIVILKTVLELCGGRVEYHVPHRIREGYGMRDEVIERAAAEGVRLIISVDSGIRDFTPAEAARRAGVSEIYRLGGAQAIAALAYGTETIAPVDKIVGPGNAFVAAAKREVFGQVGIDSIAGPSEILVVADAGNNPDWIAADLLSQAEHDASSQAILITDDAPFADSVVRAVIRALATLPRSEIAGASWRDHGAVIVVNDLNEAPALVDRIAPEHLELAVADPEALLDRVRHAGAIFLGRYTPEAIGDYIAGPNHVLPTARTARFSSGLSTLDFMKRTTLMSCTPDAVRALGPDALVLAECEGLDAHARSIAARLNSRA